MAVLDNGAVRVEIDGEYGRIVSLRHTVLDIEVIGDRRLAENFRLLVPLPGRAATTSTGATSGYRKSTLTARDAVLPGAGCVRSTGTSASR
jgi:hypothetical protein